MQPGRPRDGAFDEIVAETRLESTTRLIVILASTIRIGAVSEFKVLAGAAPTVGVGPVEIKEIVYQSVAYVRMGRAFDFVHAANAVLTDRKVQLPLEGQSTDNPATRPEKGLAVQEAIFGAMIEEMYERSPKDQLHLRRICPRTAQRSLASPNKTSTGLTSDVATRPRGCSCAAV